MNERQFEIWLEQAGMLNEKLDILIDLLKHGYHPEPKDTRASREHLEKLQKICDDMMKKMNKQEDREWRERMRERVWE